METLYLHLIVLAVFTLTLMLKELYKAEKYSVRSEVQVTKFLILCKKGLLKTFLL